MRASLLREAPPSADRRAAGPTVVRAFGGAVARLALAALALVAAPSAARAEDWPSEGFGPAHRRMSSERSGPEFGAHPWTVDVPAAEWSTSGPAVADGILVIGARDGSVRALEARTGRGLWRFEAGDSVMATPAIHKGRVFVPALDNRLYALRLLDGAVLWSKNIGGLEQSSPTIVDDSVLVAGGFPLRTIFRIDAATGRSLWGSSPAVMAEFSNAAVATDGALVVAGALEGHYYGFELATGAHRWTYDAGGIVNRSAPVISNGRVFLLPGGKSGRVHAVRLDTGAAVAGWPVDLPAPEESTVSGKRLSRQYAVSSLAAGAGRLFLDVRFDDAIDTNADGLPDEVELREVAMALSATDGHLLWQRNNGRQVIGATDDVPKGWLCPTPALYHGRASDAGDGVAWVAVASTLLPSIQILDARGGAPRGMVALAGPSRISPVLANGRLLVATDRGTIHGFASTTNRPPAAPTFPEAQERVVSSVAPVVHWNAAMDPDGDAVSYEVRVDSDGEVLESWQSDVLTGVGVTQARLPHDLEPGVSYIARLRARDASGAWSEWSAPERLRAVETPTVSIAGSLRGGLVAALLAAQPGDVVRLAGGTFHLTETVQVPAGVTLEGSGPLGTVLDGRGQDTCVSLEGSIEGRPVTLRALTVTGARIGVAVRNTRGARLANVIVRDNREIGIDVAASASATLTNATLVANGTAVRSFGAIAVKNSLIAHNELGLLADHPGSLTSTFNDVFANKVALQGLDAGPGDISSETAFVGYEARDLHVTRAQPSTDKGDPGDDSAPEPMPNGGRINLGAFGGTAEAETSAGLATVASTDRDGLGAGAGSSATERSSAAVEVAALGGASPRAPALRATPGARAEPFPAPGRTPDGCALAGGRMGDGAASGPGHRVLVIVLGVALALRRRPRPPRHRPR